MWAAHMLINHATADAITANHAQARITTMKPAGPRWQQAMSSRYVSGARAV